MMRRYQLAAGSIVLLTTVAYAQPIPIKHPSHPAFIVAGDRGSQCQELRPGKQTLHCAKTSPSRTDAKATVNSGAPPSAPPLALSGSANPGVAPPLLGTVNPGQLFGTSPGVLGE